MKKLSVLLSVAFMALPLSSFAHDGHGLFNGGEVIHYLSSPLHIFPILGVFVIGALFLVKRKRTQMKNH
jgi:hypothetical protein